MIIRSSSQLCQNYDTFSKLAHETQEPIYITKEGEGDIVLLSIEAFENMQYSVFKAPPPLPHVKQNNNTIGDIHMTEQRLGRILKTMYWSAAKGQQVANIHTFSIYYARIIENERLNKKEILRAAELSETYQTEISKGVNLAQYVEVKDDIVKYIKNIEETTI